MPAALHRQAAAAGPSPRGAYRLGELFAGAGGMALGARQARRGRRGFVHVWASDMDRDACDTLARNALAPEGAVHCCRVEKLDFGRLAPIDGLAFGFPCNDFSMVGDRNGIGGKHGGLYRWGVRALRRFRPAFFVAENVGGLRSSGDGDFETILRALKRAGYATFPHVYRFEDFGVPQTRHRIIIVGFRKDLGISEFRHPEPTHAEPVTAAEALAGIPGDAHNHERTRQAERVVERLKHIRPGENAFTADMPGRLRLKLASGATISQIYRRLKPDAPSYTVTGSGGGGTHIYHWKEHRALTNRERARLQTFPDGFAFSGGKESVRKQIGMAVPPGGARVVFRAVLDALVGHGVPAGAPAGG